MRKSLFKNDSGRKRDVGLAVALFASLVAAPALFGAVPEGYTQLAYLESTGSQYIDTGVVFGPTNGFSVAAQTTVPVSDGQFICGSREDDGDTRCTLGSVHDISNSAYYGYDRIGWNNIVMSDSRHIQNVKMGTTDVNFLNSGKFDCRGVSSGPLGSLAAQTGSFWLFASRTMSSGEVVYGKCRIREARISANAAIIRSFVPVRRDSDSTLGMYDLVEGRFYANQGTGSFIGGPALSDSSGPDAYERLSYIESTGGQYIDTGVTFTDAHGFAIVSQTVKPVNNQVICGSRASSGDKRCIIGSNWNQRSGEPTYAYVGWNGLPVPSTAAVQDGVEGEVKVNYRNSRSVDCRGQASAALGELAAQTGSFWLFAGNMAYSGGSTIYGNCRIMSFTMTLGDDVVMDMVPVRRKADGKPGMYDTLNDRFYVNLGALDFLEGESLAPAIPPELPEGYARLDFVESTGTQYINTGVKCSSDVKVEVTAYNARPLSKHFVGARTDYKVNAIGLSFQAENTVGYRVAWGGNEKSALMGQSLSSGVGDEFHTFEFGGPYVRIDGLYRNGTAMSAQFSTGLDIFAFAVNNNGAPHSQMPSIRISSLKIYEDGSVVRDFVPAMPTNSLAPGLYDVQNGVFYGNAGEGTFLAGDLADDGKYPDILGGEGVSELEVSASEVATKPFYVANNGFYRLWFQYKAGANGAGHTLTVGVDGENLGSVAPDTTYGWTSASFDVKLNCGSHALAFEGVGAGKSTIVDSVTVRCLRELPAGLLIFVR